jgi:hypothetical protein
MYQSIQLKNTTTLIVRNSINRAPLRRGLVLITLALACFALSPAAQAVSPPPDGGYPGGNTAEGDSALLSVTTTGEFNTAVGWLSLTSNRGGFLNTGVGAGTLLNNIGDNSDPLNPKGVLNTAVGAGALIANTTGTGGTANGALALFYNTTGQGNTAVGATALFFNTESGGNTAVGAQALQNNAGHGNQEGNLNTAVGLKTLTANTTGQSNTAVGSGPGLVEDEASPATPILVPAALGSNTTGAYNTAVGASFFTLPAALGKNTEGRNNTAVGTGALNNNTTGMDNIAVGVLAGSSLTTGNNNIDIGNSGVAGEANTIRIGTPPSEPSPTPPISGQNRTFIAGIYGRPPGANTLAVVCADDGKLTANASSRRFKHDIKPMDNASEAILALKPVSFRYNNDSTDTPWFGLIAEEVAKINPDLIARDKEGKPFGVRYDQVNVMLLNEFLKEHKAFVEEQRTVQEQGATIARLQKQVETLTAGLQKVSAQLELSKSAPQTVLNNQ